jgi:hypothetical protein
MKLTLTFIVLAAFILSLGRTISLRSRFLLAIKDKFPEVYETIQIPYSSKDIFLGSPGVVQALIARERFLLSNQIPDDPLLASMQRKVWRSILTTVLLAGTWILYAAVGIRVL